MTAPRYVRTPALARLEIVGDQVAVFNAASFETHLLNSSAAALLHAMAAPRTACELAELLCRLLAPAERAAAGAHTEQALAQLLSLGLVTRVGCA